MFLSVDFIKHLETVISNLVGTSFRISNIYPVSGGDIHHSFRIESQRDSFFIKINNTQQLPNIFVLEREGLKLLKRLGGAVVPDLLVAGAFHQDAYLLMSWIETAEKTAAAQAKLGRMLASVHKNTQDYFGLEYDNYLGSLPQSNQAHLNWPDFFIEERLKKQLDRSKAKGLARDSLIYSFEKLFTKIPAIFPLEEPALLHGDLWNGNYIIDDKETPFLIDPAVYYGHREMDIALTKLFGGFDQVFYDAYEEVFPLEEKWLDRVDLCNLYVLLFHANVFGGSYMRQVASIVDRYV